jgi:hypothetical protein
MIRITQRTASKHLPCGWGKAHDIHPGERYLEHVCSPYHDDYENPRWLRSYECRPCAESSGRGSHFETRCGPHAVQAAR